MLRGALDLLLPPACLTCDAAVDRPGQFCAACFNLTNFIGEPQCRRCGVPFDFAGPRARDCEACLVQPPIYGRARSALLYDDHSRRIVLAFKHGGPHGNGGCAGAAHGAGRCHPAARGGNAGAGAPASLAARETALHQAALLARALSRLSGIPMVADGLRRVVPTISLGAHDAAERRRILKDTIIVRPHRRERLAGRRVLLIDDVLTSGATADTCAAVLLTAGAASVDVLAAARVPRQAD